MIERSKLYPSLLGLHPNLQDELTFTPIFQPHLRRSLQQHHYEFLPFVPRGGGRVATFARLVLAYILVPAGEEVDDG